MTAETAEEAVARAEKICGEYAQVAREQTDKLLVSRRLAANVLLELKAWRGRRRYPARLQVAMEALYVDIADAPASELWEYR